MSSLPTYVLITPARNEADYIELTLQPMATQPVRPLKWGEDARYYGEVAVG